MKVALPRLIKVLARDMTDNRCCVVRAGDTSHSLVSELKPSVLSFSITEAFGSMKAACPVEDSNPKATG